MKKAEGGVSGFRRKLTLDYVATIFQMEINPPNLRAKNVHTITVRSLLDPFEQLVDLRCHNEIILMQAIDLMGLKLHFAVAPTDADVRMMALGLAQFADFLGVTQRIHEVFELEGSFDFLRFVSKLPVRNLLQEFFGFHGGEGRYTALARGTLFGCERT
jgi:hypothetical protein